MFPERARFAARYFPKWRAMHEPGLPEQPHLRTLGAHLRLRFANWKAIRMPEMRPSGSPAIWDCRGGTNRHAAEHARACKFLLLQGQRESNDGCKLWLYFLKLAAQRPQRSVRVNRRPAMARTIFLLLVALVIGAQASSSSSTGSTFGAPLRAA